MRVPTTGNRQLIVRGIVGDGCCLLCSTSDGLAGGAFGTPDRFSNSAEDYTVNGNW
jgi:hypothetical protein